ncbi:uncharacterized protein LDX57_011513 [Aspergillus melleus]|uniref:uncharacterized protein n=1 Tax=Aspergillus melleus TaxID=138277 RepID=UPI001E8CB9EB|nr:uncharacterized protein LDX57_011513 [Aspergillus melleus]KAH8433877.1 hypothetical protein LDX57_011513 [Aspergillus melleus]
MSTGYCKRVEDLNLGGLEAWDTTSTGTSARTGPDRANRTNWKDDQLSTREVGGNTTTDELGGTAKNRGATTGNEDQIDERTERSNDEPSKSIERTNGQTSGGTTGSFDRGGWTEVRQQIQQDSEG